MANMKAPIMKIDSERASISVSAVIDKSGSMSGSKLELTKATLRFVIGNLRDTDEFGIISYASDVVESLKLTRMDLAGRKKANLAVNGINADGCTNLSGGLFAGIDQLKGVPVQEKFQGSAQTQKSRVLQRVQLQVPFGAGRAVPSNPSVDIGNEFNSIPSSSSVLPNWTMFVRLSQGMEGNVDDLIQSVQYRVGSELVTVAKAPFELTRADQSAPIIEVIIKLCSPHGSVEHHFQHILNFASPLTFSTHTLSPVALPPSVPDAVPRASSTRVRNDVAAVWLFTDGLANEGIQDRPELVQMTNNHLKDMHPACTLFTFGFGEDHDASLLKDVADAGKGMYYYVKDEASIAEAFADCLGGLLSVVAQGLTLTALAEPGCIIRKAFTSYEHDITPAASWVKVPDLYSEEERDFIWEVEVAPVDPAFPAPAPIVQFRLEYHNSLTEKPELATGGAMLSRPQEAKLCKVHPQLDKQRNRVWCTEAIHESKMLADKQDLPAARQKLDAAIAAIQASDTGSDPFCIGLVEDLEDCKAQVETETQYKAVGEKTMMNAVSCHGNQRSCGMKQRYATTSQKAMVQNWKDQQQ